MDGRRMPSFVHNTTTHSIVLCIVHVWTHHWLSRRGGCKGHMYHMSLLTYYTLAEDIISSALLHYHVDIIPIPIIYIYLYLHGYKPWVDVAETKPYIHLMLIPSIPISVVLDRESLGVSKG